MAKGSIVKRGKTYSVVLMAYTPDGEYKQKWISGFTTKKEAESYLREHKNKSYDNEVLIKHIKLSKYLDDWIKNYCERKGLANNTIRGYKVNIYNHIIPSIGNYYIDDINANVLDKLFDDLDLKGLSGTSQLYVYRVLHKAFETGVKRRELMYNYCDMIEPPKKCNPKLESLESNEMQTYYDFLCDYDIKFSLPIILALFLGLRRGEVLGLRWPDVDFDKKTMFIQRTATPSKKGGYVIDSCKTEKSVRMLLVPDVVIDKLLEWDSIQSEFNIINPDGYIFMQDNNKLLCSSTLQKRFKSTLKECDLCDMRFHDLRHSFASYLVSSSVPINTVSQMLGHSKISTTLDIYTHTDTMSQAIALNELKKIAKY